MKTALCIPTRNGIATSALLIENLSRQSCSPSCIVIVDTDSSDGTPELWSAAGAQITGIARSSFNHGATRQLALTLCPDADIIIYMTQDAILASPNSIKNILAPFRDEKVGAVCGRQLPHADASPIAAHARLFNYPPEFSIRTKKDIPSMGIKAAFLSNSFAAYRRAAITDVGGFPSDVIFGEDTYVAAKMLLADWKVVYSAEACCFHSHNYSIKEDFRRYFDIGVFHSREKWYIEACGKPEGEGKKFVLSEIKNLIKLAPWMIPSALLRTGLKFLGYKVGQQEKYIPIWLKKKMSMNKGYWN
jgi:rhamnosyltransferase